MIFRRLPVTIAVLLLIGGISLLFSCKKNDKVDTNPALMLSFSTDTVFFDTVFTTVGSITQRLMVYNPNKNKLLISSISLAGGDKSVFKINIDGLPASSIRDVEIPAGDSLFIFVRVTVDPTNQNTPLVIADSLLFQTNGNLQDVKLVAWGQDARFYKNVTLKGNITWDSLKPHVIYGYVRVDTAGQLTILPGAKIYFHKSSSLSVSSQSTLKVLGTLQHPVRFQGDRLDPFYKDLPGQWDGIYLDKGSKDNDVEYAIIKNGSFGLAVDTLGTGSGPVLTINNSIIKNMDSYGIYAYATNILSTNCVIGDCGGSAIAVIAGGNYDFRQLTIGNYWSSSIRFSPSLYLSNFDTDTLGNVTLNPLNNAYFGNSIFYGNSDAEIKLDTNTGAAFNATFDHALLKTKYVLNDAVHFINCLKNQDPLFKDVMTFDYRLDSISPAIGKGIQMNVPFDILGNERVGTFDLGAYQFVPGH